jgi:hypothetical protein
VARKGRARRFREARELKQRDDGFFSEGSGTLADVEDASEHEIEDDDIDKEAEIDDNDPWADLRAEAE